MEALKQIKINWLTILGISFLASLIFLAVFRVADSFYPVRHDDLLTVENFRQINDERMIYEDSVYNDRDSRLLDTIRSLTMQKNISDSIINNFYNTIYNQYEEKINASNNLSSNDIVRDWERRYANR